MRRDLIKNKNIANEIIKKITNYIFYLSPKKIIFSYVCSLFSFFFFCELLPCVFFFSFRLA